MSNPVSKAVVRTDDETASGKPIYPDEVILNFPKPETVDFTMTHNGRAITFRLPNIVLNQLIGVLEERLEDGMPEHNTETLH